MCVYAFYRYLLIEYTHTHIYLKMLVLVLVHWHWERERNRHWERERNAIHTYTIGIIFIFGAENRSLLFCLQCVRRLIHTLIYTHSFRFVLWCCCVDDMNSMILFKSCLVQHILCRYCCAVCAKKSKQHSLSACIR